MQKGNKSKQIETEQSVNQSSPVHVDKTNDKLSITPGPGVNSKTLIQLCYPDAKKKTLVVQVLFPWLYVLILIIFV